MVAVHRDIMSRIIEPEQKTRESEMDGGIAEDSHGAARQAQRAGSHHLAVAVGAVVDWVGVVLGSSVSEKERCPRRKI